MNADEKRSFNKELMTLTIPLALQNLLNALVGASDALMLGRLTQDAIAAVSLANQISFVMSLFNGAVIGSVGVLIAQYWGKRDYLNAKRFLGILFIRGYLPVFSDDDEGNGLCQTECTDFCNNRYRGHVC